MSETLTLPVLPLDDEVVLPGMVVPIELTDAEVRGAVDAARNSAGLGRGPGIRSEDKSQVLLVPRIAGRLAGTGTLAVIEQVGRMPGGEPGAVLRGVSRVKIGHGTTGPGAALWVEGTVIEETGQGARATELAKEYKSLIVAVLQQRGQWQVVDMIQQLDDPSTIADRAGYSSYVTVEQKLQLLETADIAERLETAIKWTREHLAELDVAETIRKDVTEGMEKQQKEFLLRQQLAAVRKELKELSGDGDGTEEDDYRARVEARRPAGEGPRGRAQGGRQARADLGAVARSRLDPYLARHRPRHPVERADRGRLRHRRRPRDPRRGPHRARRRQGADHRVPGGAQAPQRPGPRRDRRPPVRRGARPRRPARRRQDLARRVGRAGDGPQVRPGRARRRQGRGRDPRSPAHLRRRAARPDRPRHPRGRHDEPGRAPGRGGQDRL